MNKPTMKLTCWFVKRPLDLASMKLDSLTIHVHVGVLLYACGYFTLCFLSVRFLKWPCQSYQVIPMLFGP